MSYHITTMNHFHPVKFKPSVIPFRPILLPSRFHKLIHETHLFNLAQKNKEKSECTINFGSNQFVCNLMFFDV